MKKIQKITKNSKKYKKFQQKNQKMQKIQKIQKIPKNSGKKTQTKKLKKFAISISRFKFKIEPYMGKKFFPTHEFFFKLFDGPEFSDSFFLFLVPFFYFSFAKIIKEFFSPKIMKGIFST